DVARALDRIDEPGRCRLVPVLVILGALQRIERAVDLDGREMARRELQLAPLRQALGIEDAAPWRIAPPRDADADHPKRIFFSETSCFAFASCSSSVRSRRSGVIDT